MHTEIMIRLTLLLADSPTLCVSSTSDKWTSFMEGSTVAKFPEQIDEDNEQKKIAIEEVAKLSNYYLEEVVQLSLALKCSRTGQERLGL